MAQYYRNGNKDFYCRDSAHSGKALACASHLHYRIELALVKSGKTVLTVDSKSYNISGGDIFIVFPNQVHHLDTLERENYILMVVNPDIIPEISHQLISGMPETCVFHGAAFDPELSELARKISDIYHSTEEYRDCILRGYLLAFFGKLLQKIEIHEAETNDSDVLGIIINYCVDNFDKPLSLDLLQKELHISKYYISHTVSNKLHMGFNDYINSLRVSAACKYLLMPDKSITEISDLVGFNTMRTFNRAFQKKMGISPSQYRTQKGIK